MDIVSPPEQASAQENEFSRSFTVTPGLDHVGNQAIEPSELKLDHKAQTDQKVSNLKRYEAVDKIPESLNEYDPVTPMAVTKKL